MHSLIKFISQHSNFLVFLLLEVAAVVLIVNNNEYPHSQMLSTANSIVATHYQIVDNIDSYFSLRRTNQALEQENADLRNQLTMMQNLMEDSTENAYIYSHLQLHYIPAKVIQLTTNRPHNYLTINKGRRDSIHEGMGVLNHEGVVGIVRTVSEQFAVVIPILHTSSSISCRLKKNDYIGTMEWDGKSSHYGQLMDIASHIEVTEGDTIITSGLTGIFPKGIPVGIVESCTLKQGASYYTIRARLMVDFRKLEYVQVIDNQNANEIKRINDGLD